MFPMFQSHFTRHWFSSQALEQWADTSTLQAWLDTEVALASAQADLGLIPRSAATRIEEMGKAELFDLDHLSAGIASTMHPLVPVLREFEKLCGEDAAGFIHWGVTTQNIFETGAVLQLRRSHELLLTELDRALAALATLAQDNSEVLQAGRTHGQHALPITFGFKVAGWHAELRRERALLAAAGQDALVVRLGGAVGTFAAMGGKGRAVQDRVADLLGLGSEEVPVRTAFDRFAHYISILGLMAGTAQKIAQEVVFLQRTEIGEVEEAFHMGKVGSSTMAQKRNPSRSQNIIGLCRLLRSRVPLAQESMVRENEGDASASNVADVLVPETSVLGCSIAGNLAQLVEGLVVYPAAMARNLELSGGMILSEAVMMQLADTLGRHHAHEVLYEAAMRTVEEGGSFSEAILQHEKVAAASETLDLDRLLAPAYYVGEAAACADEESAR
ncbi:adenylosuccinate lyase family protein [Devosia sp. YIM 151766]|uniref:class-II fumarase/aspartase family protein n=1 Tax=Devosia sp. YIM 151766 TaxID=3017325 RepID=UPI00255C2B75|nr:adenylosuccinate lyase family protein [Devosia sp. YIM 151766]WIY53897.1 adenylosuccinate lyase family protein [Devosia sp. YIM 151766]